LQTLRQESSRLLEERKSRLAILLKAEDEKYASEISILEKEAQTRIIKAQEDKVLNYRLQRENERKAYSTMQYERLKESMTDD